MIDILLQKLELSTSHLEAHNKHTTSYVSVVQKQRSLVIKPKTKQNSTFTKSDMIENIKPV